MEQTETTYKDAERKVNSAYKAAMEKVLMTREKAEKQAEELYCEARDNANKVYQTSIRQAPDACNEALK